MGGKDVDGMLSSVFEGVTVEVNVGTRTSTELATRGDQAKTVAQVAGCTRCADDLTPGERGIRVTPTLPVKARFVVVLPDGDLRTRKLLEVALKNAKVGVANVAWVNRVACVTIGSGSEWEDAEVGKPRMPNRGELDNCIGNCSDSMWAANTDFVLLVGAGAKNMWRPDLTMGQVVGKVGVLWDRYICMVVDNPSGVDRLQGAAKKKVAGRIVSTLRAWGSVLEDRDGRLVEGGMGLGPRVPVTAAMGRECAECGDKMVASMDRDGLGWCGEHRNDLWMKARGLDPTHGEQGKML